MGLKWSARAEISALQSTAQRLDLENRNFRAATGELATQLQSLQAVVGELGAKATVDSDTARAMDRLPAIVKSRASGGPIREPAVVAFAVFATRRWVAGRHVRRAARPALHAREPPADRAARRGATPGAGRGNSFDLACARLDERRLRQPARPVHGSADYHPGLDISADRGDPVVATANGTVSSAQRSGAYGNMIVIDHGFGISTRYAHLDSFRVKAGDAVRRGDVVGYAGSTGRSTGSHLHYEVLVYGRHLNPLQFLLNRARP